jgi:hypothetical protein
MIKWVGNFYVMSLGMLFFNDLDFLIQKLKSETFSDLEANF